MPSMTDSVWRICQTSEARENTGHCECNEFWSYVLRIDFRNGCLTERGPPAKSENSKQIIRMVTQLCADSAVYYGSTPQNDSIRMCLSRSLKRRWNVAEHSQAVANDGAQNMWDVGAYGLWPTKSEIQQRLTQT